jgi:hypothetical protein
VRGGIHNAVDRQPSVVYANPLLFGLWRSWIRKKRLIARFLVREFGNM